MSTLILRLAGPLQSWGGATRHMTRSTRPAPSKSGVVGILAAALGRQRGDDLSDLAELLFGTRLDQPGRFLIDYHTVSGASHAPNAPERQRLPTSAGGWLPVEKSTKITRRHYIADAVFIAALEGDEPLVETCAAALSRPRYPLYLGRRSCPPARPVLMEKRDDCGLVQALESTPWQATAAEEHRRRREADRAHPGSNLTEIRLDAYFESADGDEVWDDQPCSGPAYARQFTDRPVAYTSITMPLPELATAATSINHDPMGLL